MRVVLMQCVIIALLVGSFLLGQYRGRLDESLKALEAHKRAVEGCLVYSAKHQSDQLGSFVLCTESEFDKRIK